MNENFSSSSSGLAVTLAPTLQVTRLAHPPTLDDPVWDTTSSFTLTLDKTRIVEGQTPQEPGQAKLAYDDHAVYLRVDFVDHDVTTTATADHDLLYKTGDVAEWFIGPPPGPNDPENVTEEQNMAGVYLELHVAPNGLRSAYRVTRPGLGEKIMPIPFTAEVSVKGTLNDHENTDRGWAAQMTLPWSVLNQLAPSLADTEKHKPEVSALIARYNYGHHLPYRPDGSAGPELTMYPTQPKTKFHLRPFHGVLVFED